MKESQPKKFLIIELKCVLQQLKENGRINLNISKKKFIYLISPNKINKDFYKNLKLLFNTNKVSFFQMRLKKYSINQKILIGKKIKRICRSKKVKFIINDDPWLVKILNADGCHLGQNDMSIEEARKIIGRKKIIGITCHNSIKLAKNAIKSKANYLAFGAFFSTRTKKIKFHATKKNLKEVKKLTNIPIVAIGGVNSQNYKNLLLNKADFLAISGYIWKNKKYKPINAIERIK